MGQATVDLPDPLDTPAPDTLAGTDDLLAQIAGDEIDRLIAESQDERGPSAPRGGQPAPPREVTPALSADFAASVPAAALVPAAASAPAAPQDICAAALAPPVMPVDGADHAVDTTPAGDEDADDTADAPATLSPAALEADAELDKLLDEMSQAERGVAQPNPAPTPAATSAAAPPASAGAPAAQPAPDAELLMSSQEREALKLAAIDAETDAAEADDAAVAAAAQAESAPRPLPVAVLEMINAPLSFIPDGLRDVLGKVAILTLVNSLAVLVYVLFIRR